MLSTQTASVRRRPQYTDGPCAEPDKDGPGAEQDTDGPCAEPDTDGPFAEPDKDGIVRNKVERDELD
jgi:hypothetical protein